MKKVEVKFWEGKVNLCEAFSRGMQLSMVSAENEQMMPFVHCKDYFQDALWGAINNKKCSQYGYVFDPSKHKSPDLKLVKILITNKSDENFGSKVKKLKEFLNSIEKDLKMPSSKIAECKNPPAAYQKSGVWIVIGNKRWLKSPPMISMYSLLIRVGMAHEGGEWEETVDAILKDKKKVYQSADKNNIVHGINGIKRIIQEGDRNIFHKDIKENYKSSLLSSTLHNHTGICAFSQGYTKSWFPEWHKSV